MSTKTRYADHIKEWEGLTAAVAAHASELPDLETARAALEKLLGEVTDLTTQQSLLRANKQKVSLQLRTLIDEGIKLATVIRVTIKQRYGNRSEDLLKFGLQPFRGRARKVKPTPPPEGPTEPSTDPPAGQPVKSAE